MTEATQASNVVELRGREGGGSGVQRLAPIEVKWVKQADVDTADIEKGWRRRASDLCGRINRLDHELRQTLETYAVAHRAHREKGLIGFYPKIAGFWYWPLLVLVAALELPLNAAALDAWRLDQDETRLVALGMSLMILVVASLLGRAARHIDLVRRKWKDIAVELVVIAAALGVIGALTEARQALLSASPDVQAPAVSMWAILAMQLFLFVGAAYISYQAHSPDADLERILKDKAKLRKQVERLWRTRLPLAAAHDRELTASQASIQKRRDETLAMIAEYRDDNMRYRTSIAPVFFLQFPDMRVFRTVVLGAPLDGGSISTEELIHQAEERVYEIV